MILKIVLVLVLNWQFYEVLTNEEVPPTPSTSFRKACNNWTDFTCKNGQCISILGRCDTLFQCEDKSDEENCSTTPILVGTTTATGQCREDQITCYDGFCIDGRQRCDGAKDCSQGEDEDGCSPSEEELQVVRDPKLINSGQVASEYPNVVSLDNDTSVNTRDDLKSYEEPSSKKISQRGDASDYIWDWAAALGFPKKKSRSDETSTGSTLLANTLISSTRQKRQTTRSDSKSSDDNGEEPGTSTEKMDPEDPDEPPFSGASFAQPKKSISENEAPMVEIYPKDKQSVSVGDLVLVQCRVSRGKPSPTLTWTRTNNQQLSSHVEVLDNGTLRFSHITKENEGQYICTASNSAGSVSSVATLEVNSPSIKTLYPLGSYIASIRRNIRVEYTARDRPNLAYPFWLNPNNEYSPQRSRSFVNKPIATDFKTYGDHLRDSKRYNTNAADDSARVIEEKIHLVIEQEDNDVLVFQ